MTNEVVDLYLAPWSSEAGKKALFRNFRRLNPEYTQAIAGDLKSAGRCERELRCRHAADAAFAGPYQPE